MPVAIGIDFGTSNSAVGFFNEGVPCLVDQYKVEL